MAAPCRYTTGKLPKAFKIIPHLQNWEDVVFITDPERWSPHATYAATKMFVSQLNTKQTQRFLNLILLNKVRDDVRKNKRLHFALFQAVKKAVFKPGAFYKGLVLPLLQSGDCTLREAVIFSSILTKVSIPVDHSAAVRLPCPSICVPSCCLEGVHICVALNLKPSSAVLLEPASV
jgi:essential nuclear protein 1